MKRRVRGFKLVDESGKTYAVIEFELIIASGEVRPDGLSRRARTQTIFELKNGTAVTPVEGEPDTFKIGNIIAWKIR